MSISKQNIGDMFQQLTKYRPDNLPRGGLDMKNIPKTYKEYPENEAVALPAVQSTETASLMDVLMKRKSVRSFQETPLTLRQLSFLLWASAGIQRHERGRDFRTAPSAGALYPVETYVVINNVEDLKPGVYHYNIKKHALELLKAGDFSIQTAEAALGQDMCALAPAVFVWTAVVQRCRWKYRQRSYRYIYMDAGHVAENLALAAVGVGLASCQAGALFDDELNKLIDVDGDEETAIYMSVVGMPY